MCECPDSSRHGGGFIGVVPDPAHDAKDKFAIDRNNIRNARDVIQAGDGAFGIVAYGKARCVITINETGFARARPAGNVNDKDWQIVFGKLGEQCFNVAEFCCYFCRSEDENKPVLASKISPGLPDTITVLHRESGCRLTDLSNLRFRIGQSIRACRSHNECRARSCQHFTDAVALAYFILVAQRQSVALTLWFRSVLGEPNPYDDDQDRDEQQEVQKPVE